MRKICLLVAICLLISNPLLSNIFAQEHTQWDLPKGAKARFGKGWIRDIKFSAFGSQLAVATTIGVWIYDVRTGEEMALLSGIMGGANSISYSPGGLMLASAHWDHTIRLWDLNADTDRPRTTFREHTGEIHTVTFSPDGSMLASGSADKTIRIWNPHAVIDSEKLISILPYKASVNTAVFSPDSQLLAGGSEDGMIHVWDAGTGDLVYPFEGHTNSVWEIDFSPDGRILASASLDGTVQLWNLVAPGGRLAEPTQHAMPVYAVDFSQDGRNFVTSGADKEIRVWNTNTREVTSTLEGHNDIIPIVEFSPDGTTSASGSLDGTVRLWDMRLARERLRLAGHTGGVKALTYTEDNRIQACGPGLDNKLRLWDAGTGKQLTKLGEHRGLTQAVAFSKNGKRLASAGSENGTIFVSDISKALENNDDILEATLTGNALGITALALSPADTTLASGGTDGRIYLLNVDTGAELKILKGSKGTITALAFYADGTHLYSGEENGTVRRWDALTGQEVWSYTGSFSAITALAFSENGRFLAIGDKVGKIRLFDFSAELEIDEKPIFTRHTRRITALMFSKNSDTLVSGSEDGTILLWDMNEILLNAEEQETGTNQDQSSKKNNTEQQSTIPRTPQEIAQNALNSTVYLEMQKPDGTISQGSGFFIRPSYIVTNHHVIEGATKAYVKLVGKQITYRVESIAATDEYYDLAVLKLSGITAPTLSLANSDTVQIGETVYVAGNPKGLEGTFSSGIISAVRAGGNDKLIQIDASISPGSSGGAVLNSKGEVVGVVTWSHRDPNAQNLNFVVPSNYVKALLRRVR